MKNESRQNLMVGAFVIAGLVALGILIVLFGEAPNALKPSYRVTIHFANIGPLHQSDPVYLNGIEAGTVESIEPEVDIRQGVKVVCRIWARHKIPVTAVPVLREQTLALGKPAIRIDVKPTDSAQTLPTDGTAKLEGMVVSGIEELIPSKTMGELEEAGRALTELARKLAPVAEDLHELLTVRGVAEVDNASEADRPLANVSTLVQRFDTALRSFNRILADPANQQNIEVTLKNFRTLSETGIALADKLVKVADGVDNLTAGANRELGNISRIVADNAGKLSQLLDALVLAGRKLNTDEGTAGKLLNDPKLYDTLLLTVRQLELTLKELQNLAIQLQEKGFKLEGGLLGR